MTKYRRFLLLFILCSIWTVGLLAQITINEVSSDNESIIIDEYGSFSDWIELYNEGKIEVSLEGFHLSDSPSDLKKWAFPKVSIKSKGFLVVYASGRDTYLKDPHTNFKISKKGETISISDNKGNLLDEMLVPNLERDESYGRKPDGSILLNYFINPTPGKTNNSTNGEPIALAPDFLLEGRFHDNPVKLKLTCSQSNVDIRYTLDGSIPNLTDSIYVNPLKIESTTCIRARSFAKDYRPSSTSTQTHFIGISHLLPVVAISSDPDNFWDWNKGILVDGPDADSLWPHWGANYWKDIEIPVLMEYLDDRGNFKIAFELGTKIHGGRQARTKPLKPLRLLAKKKYGTELMDFTFFSDRKNSQFKRLVLRNASGDFNRAHFRDGMVHRMYIRAQLDVDVLAYQPIVLYINGRYQGVTNLREKADEYYLKYEKGADISNIDFLEEDTIIILGDFKLFDQHYNFIVNNDLSIQKNYLQAASYFDVNSLKDFTIGQTAISNKDSYGNNIKYWREKNQGAKWRYLFFDVEAGLGNFGWTQADADIFGDKMIEYQDSNRHINIFKAFLENDGFKNGFINRYADLLNTVFSEENMKEEIEMSRDMIAPEMIDHFKKYPKPGFEFWEGNSMDKLFDYAEERPSYARDQLENYFDLKRQVKIKISTYPEGAGTIKLNTIKPILPWEGTYFDGVPINLTIDPNPDYEFSHWLSLNTIQSKDHNPLIQYNFDQDDDIVAYFKTKYRGLDMKAYVDDGGIGKQIIVSFVLNNIDNVSLQLIGINGKILDIRAPKLYNAGKQEWRIDANDIVPGVYIVQISNSKTKSNIKLMVH